MNDKEQWDVIEGYTPARYCKEAIKPLMDAIEALYDNRMLSDMEFITLMEAKRLLKGFANDKQ